eukprot:3700075-Rhodomonas_salina.2
MQIRVQSRLTRRMPFGFPDRARRDVRVGKRGRCIARDSEKNLWYRWCTGRIEGHSRAEARRKRRWLSPTSGSPIS